jgi:hypothetical protein
MLVNKGQEPKEKKQPILGRERPIHGIMGLVHFGLPNGCKLGFIHMKTQNMFSSLVHWWVFSHSSLFKHIFYIIKILS